LKPEKTSIGDKREEVVKEKAVLKHGVLEIYLLKAHVSKKVRIETKAA
jgi:hypothetical protein